MNLELSTNKRDAAQRAIIVLGIVYLLFLIWAILWKCGVPFIGGSEVAINLEPFKFNTRWEMQFNVILFIPFAFYCMTILKKWRMLKTLGLTILLSLALESLQYALAIGHSDITDLFTNTTGGIFGIFLFYAFLLAFDRHIYKVTVVLGVLLTLAVAYIGVSMLVLGQVNLGFMTLRL